MFRLGDDYTYLRSPEEATFFNEGLNGSFEGIGARVAEAEEGGVRIVEPFEGQPAWNAGIRRGDIILAVDGKDVTKLQLTEAISLIRGPKGTKVTLSVKSSEQEPRDVEVVRDRIQVPVVEHKILDNGLEMCIRDRCFFAGVLSVIVFLYFTDARRTARVPGATRELEAH